MLPRHLKMINGHVLLHKCLKGDERRVIDGHEHTLSHGIVLSDCFADDTNFCEVVDVAEDCEVFDDAAVGEVVLAPEFSQGFSCLDWEHQYWIAHESVLPSFYVTF